MKLKMHKIALVYIALIALCLACLFAVACSKPQADIAPNQFVTSDLTTRDTDPNSAVDSIDDNQATLTFPEVYYGDTDESLVISQLKDKGATDVIHNADNTYTATFPRAAYDNLITEVKNSVNALLDSMKSDGTWISIKQVSYSDTFSSITLTVNGADYINSMDSQAVYTAGVMAGLYQEIASLPVNCTVTIVDEDGATITSSSFPDMLSEVGGDA